MLHWKKLLMKLENLFSSLLKEFFDIRKMKSIISKIPVVKRRKRTMKITKMQYWSITLISIAQLTFLPLVDVKNEGEKRSEDRATTVLEAEVEAGAPAGAHRHNHEFEVFLLRLYRDNFGPKFL
jgi:hypothetical protein